MDKVIFDLAVEILEKLFANEAWYVTGENSNGNGIVLCVWRNGDIIVNGETFHNAYQAATYAVTL